MHEQQQRPPSARSARSAKVGRGFFIALALCLIAVGGVATVTLSDTLLSSPAATEEPSMTTTSALQAAQITAPSTAKTTLTATRTTAVTTTMTTTTATAADTPLFVLPLSNTVLTAFSEQPLYNDTMKVYEAHTAVDFDGEEGQSVRALAAGTVAAVEDDPLWGPCITIDHGSGIVSVYRGVAANVTVGTVLEVGDLVGTVDAVPCEKHLGPHLHLELYQNGEAVDVTTLLKTQMNR